jgi:dTDP-4-dehydrorhamnose reductase
VRVYVFGAEGQIARSLREAAVRYSDIEICYSGRRDVSILRPDLVEKALNEFSPNIVVNPAAYTWVDKAETEPDMAFAINRDGARIVAAAAKRLGVPIIHLSTDYVFNGQKDSSYVESDLVDPQSVYGHSKLEGEYAVAAANDRHLVLRTSWVYASFGSNFVRTIIRMSKSGTRLRIVDDQIGCPTYAWDVADAILTIAKQIEAFGWSDRFAGVTHLAGPDALTWCTFARMIVSTARKYGGDDVAIEPISTADFPVAAKRPQNSWLCCDRLAEVFDVSLPPLEHSLDSCIGRLIDMRN